MPLIFSREPGAATSSATGFERYSLDKQYTAYGLACATLPNDADGLLCVSALARAGREGYRPNERGQGDIRGGPEYSAAYALQQQVH